MKRNSKRILVSAWVILSVFLYISTVQGAETRIRILHLNDFHGFAEPYKPLNENEELGGIAYLSQRVSKLRSDEGVHTLLVAAGDMIQGHPWTNLNKGRASIEVMNLMRLDALALGNHEFDFGVAELERRIGEAAFPVLAANVQGIKGIKPYVIKKLGDVRVAFVGIITPDTPSYTHPRNVKGVVFGGVEETCRRYLAQLSGQAEVFVLLTHIGHGEDRRLAAACPGVHVVIGGHSHSRVEEPPVVGGALVCQAWEHAKALGVVDLVVEEGRLKAVRGRLETIRPRQGEGDSVVQEVVTRYAEAAVATLQEVIGKARIDLNGTDARRRETNLGNLIADAVRTRTGADMALVNGGSIRRDIPAGDIRLRDLYGVMPFDSFPVVVRLTGRDVRRALEHGVSFAAERGGAFLQVSGVSFAYDPEAASGCRVRDVWVGGKVLEDGAFYGVAVNDFIAVGGDGFTLSVGEATVDMSFQSETIRDITASYIRERGVVDTAVEGRITVIGRSPGVR